MNRHHALRPAIFPLVLAAMVAALAFSARAHALEGSNDHVSVTAQASPEIAAASTGVFRLDFVVEKNWHIFDPAQPDPNATVISADLPEGFSLGPWTFPKPHETVIYGLVQLLHEGAFSASAPVNVAEIVAPGRYELRVLVTVSACSGDTCLGADEPISVSAMVTVIPRGASAVERIAPATPVQPVAAGTDAAGTKPGGPASPTKAPAAGVQSSPASSDFASAYESGLWSLLLLALVAGLGSTLLPCVFPLIPITVGFFANQSRGAPVTGRGPGVGGQGSGVSPASSPKPQASGLKPQASPIRTFALAGVYVSGMVAFYVIIGVLAATVGDPSWVNSPWVVGAIIALFLTFAASMFGAFEIQVPSFLRQKLVVQGKQGYGGALLMGLVMGIAAFACVGPFIGSGITFVIGAPLWLGALAFGVFGLGQGLPFLAAVFLGDRLGRPGAWMQDVKHFFGLVFLLAALEKGESLLPATLLIDGIEHATEPWVAIAWAVLWLITGVFLLMATRQAKTNALTVLARAGGMIALLLGGIAFAGQAIERGWFLSPELQDALLSADGGEGADVELMWHEDFDAALEEAKREQKPIFVDFWQIACANCLKMEHEVLRKRAFKRVARHFVLARLDCTGGAGNDNHERRKRDFNTVGAPWFGFYSAEGAPMPQFGFGTQSLEQSVAALESVLALRGDADE